MVRTFGMGLGLAVIGLAGLAMAQGGAPTRQGAGQWRAAKLVGLPIYGPNVTSVGKVSDLLMSKDGRIEAVVIGIGGLLGIGEKDVALPFDQVTFSDQPIPPQPAPATPNGGPAALAPTKAETSALTGGDTPMAPAASDVLGAPSHSTAYPDHGTIAMTAEQLRGVPAFQYAP